MKLGDVLQQDGDLCIRRVREDRYEVSRWVGDLPTGRWVEQKAMTLAELNREVRTHPFLGKLNEWEYYRPAEAGRK
jgi:hypothetical protein